MKQKLSFFFVLPALLLVAAGFPFPETIDLPEGFAGEGITEAPNGRDFFAGSLADGRIAKGTIRSGDIEIFVDDPVVAPAVGLAADLKAGVLFVAGGPSGQGAAYDLRTGDAVAVFDFAVGSSSFVNDVAVTRDGAYFTDSRNPVLYVVPIQKNGDLGDPFELALTGSAAETPGAFNNNGIAARSTGKQLVVPNSSSGVLSVIDAATGESEAIDIDGETFPTADGVLIEGRSLYILQNGNAPGVPNQITQVNLRSDFRSGTVVRSFSSSLFETATTFAKFGPRFAAVNAQFGGAPIDPQGEVVITLGR